MVELTTCKGDSSIDPPFAVVLPCRALLFITEVILGDFNSSQNSDTPIARCRRIRRISLERMTTVPSSAYIPTLQIALSDA